MTDFGCMRLAAVIFTLREDGLDISTNNITRNGKTFAQYSLITKKPVKEMTLLSRTPSTGYENKEFNVCLCVTVTQDLINSPEEQDGPIFIRLSEDDTLELTVKCLPDEGICHYLLIDGKEVQVLSGAFKWVNSYLGDKTGSMTISYE